MQDSVQSTPWERELPPPDGVDAEGSSEILRAWIVHGELCVSMRSEIVSHPVQWGGILADLARYVMLLFDDGADRAKCQKILDEVVRGFEERLLNPEQTLIEVDDRENGGS